MLSTVTKHGWRLIQVTGEMIESGEALRLIEQALQEEVDR